jgi:hypothetical protein
MSEGKGDGWAFVVGAHTADPLRQVVELHRDGELVATLYGGGDGSLKLVSKHLVAGAGITFDNGATSIPRVPSVLVRLALPTPTGPREAANG